MSQEALQSALVALTDGLASAGGPLASLREAGRAAFVEQGLPTTRHEEWLYTSLKPMAELTPGLAADGGSASVPIDASIETSARLVFVDGHYRADLSTAAAVDGVEVSRLAEAGAGALGTLADAKQHPFVALNGALVTDGALVRIAADADVARPIHLVFASGGSGAQASPISAPRVWVEVGSGARAVVVEDHVALGSDPTIVCGVTELSVAANATLDHVVLQCGTATTRQTGHLALRLERDARCTTHTLTLGGRLVRNDVEAVLAGVGAECGLRGLTLAQGDALVDHHTLVDHAVPHGSSDELYKTVLGGNATGVFRGRVLVRPDAQKTDAQQSNPNLLLCDGAEVNTKPQLEIYADDVKCSHGSAIGKLDDDALFYLRSRGIAEPDARALLTQGFVAEILDALPGDALGPALQTAVNGLLRSAGENA